MKMILIVEANFKFVDDEVGLSVVGKVTPCVSFDAIAVNICSKHWFLVQTNS